MRNERALLYHRHRLVQMRTRVKNSLQAIALSFGKPLGVKLFTRTGRQQLQALQLPEYMQQQRTNFMQLLEQLDEKINQLDEEIEKLIEKYPQAELLQTHPGVGAVTALATVLILEPVSRFSTSKQVASYLGLVPAERSSGGVQRFGKLTKQGNKLLRYLIMQCANAAIKSDSELKRLYHRLLYRKGPQKAKTAVGRKLAIRLYILLRDSIGYEEFCKRRVQNKVSERPMEGYPAGRA